MKQSQSDKANVEALVLQTVKQFLKSLKKDRALRAANINSDLDKDLGIGSLDKVELFHQLESSFGVYLPDRLMIDAQTVKDLVEVIFTADKSGQIKLSAIIEKLEQTQFDPSNAETLVEILLKRGQFEADRPQTYLQDEYGTEKIITYGDLLTNASKVAAGLYNLGIRPKDTVGIMLPTGSEFFYVFLGVLLSGGIPVPIYPPFRPANIEEYVVREAKILQNCAIKILVTFDKAERLSEILRPFIKSLQIVTTAADLLQTEGKAPSCAISGEDAALIQYTSGSTSDPKGVLLSHYNILSNIRCIASAINLQPSDLGVSWLPLYHDMGLIGTWLNSFYHAVPIVIMSPISFLMHPERWLWAIHYHKATLSAAPNFAYELCIKRILPEKLEGLDLSTWRLALNGAEQVHPKTLENFYNKFKAYGLKETAILPVYGLAESSVGLLIPPLNRKPVINVIDKDSFEKEQIVKPATANKQTLNFVSVGKPIPKHEVKIIDEGGKEIAEGRVGLLYFKGPSTMQGYYNNKKETANAYKDGWLETGDLAYMANGEVYITGRKKDIIIKAGRNIYPNEVEDITSQVQGVRKGCNVAFGVTDEKLGTEKLVIVAETRETDKNIINKMAGEITEKVAAETGVPPDQVILVPPQTVLKTSSGKLQRSACKQKYITGQLVKAKMPVWLQITKLVLRSWGVKITKGLSLIVQVLYTSYNYFLLVLTGIPLWLLVILAPQKIAATVTKAWAWFITFCIFCPIKLKNKDNIYSSKPVIYIANHSSYVDSIILMAILPNYIKFVVKKEVLNNPSLWPFIKKLGYLTVDRVDFAKNLSDIVKIKEIIEQGDSVVIYPEGTFIGSPGIGPFKLGAFQLAAQTQTPICPLTIEGTRRMLWANQILMRPGKITITAGELIIPKDDSWEEITRLHNVSLESIASKCDEDIISG